MKVTAIVLGVLMILVVSAPVDAQIAAILRAASGLFLTTAGTAAATEVVADAVTEEPLTLMLTQNVVLPNDQQVVELPSGAIVPAVEQCPEGWVQHVDDDGNDLYFPYGLFVDEHRTPRAGENFYLLRACVKE